MPLSHEQYIRWSRFGMEPYNWILENKLMASVFPVDIEYIHHLRDVEGITSAVDLAENPWVDEWRQVEGMEFHHVPVVDMSIPTENDADRIISIIDRSDGPVLIHCAAGIGRTGTIMGLYLVNDGMDPEEAISFVRNKRNGSIQTLAQEDMIRDRAKRNGG